MGGDLADQSVTGSCTGSLQDSFIDASIATSGASGATSTSIRQPSQTSVEESLSDLGRATESLLRTMRLDVVLLGSREEEMRTALEQLERQWAVLERLLEQQQEQEEKNNEGGEEGGGDGDGGPTNQPVERRRRSTGDRPVLEKKKSLLCASTVNWEGTVDVPARDEQGDGGKQGDGRKQTRRRSSVQRERRSQLACSSLDWGGLDNSESTAERGMQGASLRGVDEDEGGDDKQQQQQHNNRWSFFRKSKIDFNASSNTVATTQSPSKSDSDATIPVFIQPVTEEPTDEVDAEVLSALQLKLSGCDLAALTLQQHLSYQTRNLLDLRHERNSIQSSSQFDENNSNLELERLRARLHAATLERRRKSRLLEEATKKNKKSRDQEDRLKGELESIRTELCVLNTQMKKEGLVEQDNRSEGGSQKVVIVGGGTGSSESSDIGLIHQRAPRRDTPAKGIIY